MALVSLLLEVRRKRPPDGMRVLNIFLKFVWRFDDVDDDTSKISGEESDGDKIFWTTSVQLDFF